MQLKNIFTTQRKLRNVSQLNGLLEAITNGDLLPQVRLAQFDDGSVHIEDGHHRTTAYWLSGREELQPHEYILVLKEEQDRTRFGKIADLWDRMDC